METTLHPLKTAKVLVAGVLLCAAVGLAGFLIGRTGSQPPEATAPDPIVLESRLTEIAELATVSYHYTNMAQFESSSDFYGVKIPFTTKRFILSYDGEIKGGVDLSEAVVEVRDTVVTVTLPAPEILSHEILQDTLEVFDEKTSIFNPFRVEEFNDFQADQKEVMEDKALASGLQKKAGEKARNSVRYLLEQALPEGYTLSVE